MDINSDTVLKIKERYNQIHPLIVHRSLERAKSPGDLFDILDSLWVDMQNNDKLYPIVWHDEQHRWAKSDDLFQSLNFIAKQKEQK